MAQGQCGCAQWVVCNDSRKAGTGQTMGYGRPQLGGASVWIKPLPPPPLLFRELRVRVEWGLQWTSSDCLLKLKSPIRGSLLFNSSSGFRNCSFHLPPQASNRNNSVLLTSLGGAAPSLVAFSILSRTLSNTLQTPSLRCSCNDLDW